jgi:hypothetical protein
MLQLPMIGTAERKKLIQWINLARSGAVGRVKDKRVIL